VPPWDDGIPGDQDAPPEEPFRGERVFDIPDDTAEEPERAAAPAKKQPAPAAAPAAAPAGDTGLWEQLLSHYKGRLPVNHRVFLNMAAGVLTDDRLTVYCNNDFVKDSLNNNTVLTVLREVTSDAVGRAVQVVLTVDAAPKNGGARQTPAAPRRETDEPVQTPTPQAEQTPPWEGSDPLDELVEQGQNLKGFQIK
jgi:hypothetical protein